MILIINTSGSDIELVLDGNYTKVPAQKQSVDLPTAADVFIANCSAKWSDITAIGVVVGPGSFTGIRLGIAYAKGLGLGLNVPVIPINAFELYLAETPDAFVAIDSGHGDFFVGAKNLSPCTMTIDELETKQMEWPRTVGHRPFDLKLGLELVRDKITNGNITPAVPMYLRPSYVETNKQAK